MTREEKLMALMQDEEARKEVFVEDVDQTLANLAARDIELTKDELGELCSGMLAGMDSTEGELSEKTLENVAGGGWGTILIGVAVKDVASALKGGVSAGRKDKKGKTIKNMSYVDEANTFIGKGWRGIGYTLGWYLTRG